MNAWNGRKDEKDGKLHEWPRTQRGLPEEHWKQWRRVLDNSFLSNRDARGLKEVLLDWHDGTPRNWKWYFCSAEDRLYAKEGLLWRVYCRHRSRTSPRQGRSTYVKTEQLLREPPDGLRIASVMKQGQFIIYQCSGALMNITSDTAQNPVIESFEEGRLLRPPLDQWAIQEITVTDDGKAMAQAIRNGTAIAVSDGSYKTGRGNGSIYFRNIRQLYQERPNSWSQLDTRRKRRSILLS